MVVVGGGDIVLCGSYFQITMNKLSDIMNDIMFVLFLSFFQKEITSAQNSKTGSGHTLLQMFQTMSFSRLLLFLYNILALF